MNDNFLRRLRPMPRAAFVHDLKARLDRLPRTQSIVSGPAYLRTLLIALLIGGAAFAVTMMSMRREPTGARVSAPASLAEQSSGNTTEAPRAASAARAKSDEVSPVTPRAAYRDLAPRVVEVASGQQSQPAERAGAGSGAAASVEAAPSQVVAGIALAGAGVKWIDGMGSSFPSALYSSWSGEYQHLTAIAVSYQARGVDLGLKLLGDKAVTFAAVDVPMSAEELKASGFFQFPVVAGGVVPIVELRRVHSSQIRLDAATLALIYLGEISRWNDERIQKLNPGLVPALPPTRITLAYRSDASASTQLFTDYLARSSPSFKGRYGVSARIDVSPGVAAKGDEGMVDLIDRTDGAIGYVDYLYAIRNGVVPIKLINKDGRVVSAIPESIQSALIHADWAGSPGFGASLTDLPGERTWPMASASFAVMRIQGDRPATNAAVRFFDWAYRNGSRLASQGGYVPIPPTVADRVRESWAAALARGAPPDSGQGR